MKRHLSLLLAIGLAVVLTAGTLTAQTTGSEATDRAGNRVLAMLAGAETSAGFSPDLAATQAIIEQFPYRRESERTENLANAEAALAAQKDLIVANVAELQAEAAAKGIALDDLSLESVELEYKHQLENFNGGRAIISLVDASGELHKLYAPALYEVDGVWYVLNKMRWL